MYNVTLKYSFIASHKHLGYIEDNPIHTHNWEVKVQISSTELNATKNICEYEKIEKAVMSLDQIHLNKILVSTTSSFISKYLFEMIDVFIKEDNKTADVVGVSVSEYPNIDVMFLED